MNKIYKNEKGFSAFEILLVIFILVVIGGGGYMVYRHSHDKTTNTTNSDSKTSSTSKSPTASNTYSDWKTYSALSPVSFKYPSNWTVSTGNAATGNQSITVNAPAREINDTSYQFGLSLTTYLSPSESGEPYVPSSYPVYSSSTITDSSSPQPIYFLLTEAPLSGRSSCVTDVQAGSRNLSQGGTSGQTLSTSTSNKYLDIDGNYTMTHPVSNLSYDQTIGCFSGKDFSSFQEVQQAKQIVSSLNEN